MSFVWLTANVAIYIANITTCEA